MFWDSCVSGLGYVRKIEVKGKGLLSWRSEWLRRGRGNRVPIKMAGKGGPRMVVGLLTVQLPVGLLIRC